MNLDSTRFEKGQDNNILGNFLLSYFFKKEKCKINPLCFFIYYKKNIFLFSYNGVKKSYPHYDFPNWAKKKKNLY